MRAHLNGAAPHQKRVPCRGCRICGRRMSTAIRMRPAASAGALLIGALLDRTAWAQAPIAHGSRGMQCRTGSAWLAEESTRTAAPSSGSRPRPTATATCDLRFVLFIRSLCRNRRPTPRRRLQAQDLAARRRQAPACQVRRALPPQVRVCLGNELRLLCDPQAAGRAAWRRAASMSSSASRADGLPRRLRPMEFR